MHCTAFRQSHSSIVLFDGIAPNRAAIAEIIANSLKDAEQPGLGIWLLHRSGIDCAGCALLRPQPSTGLVELVYLLHPAHWRQGLATRMAWTTMSVAFQTIPVIVAGADGANTASIGVMRRLGMRFNRKVQYPLGTGVEYFRRHDDPAPDPRISRLSWS
jgi:RimJ/RimL family protein N-acetyltransferase